MALTFDAIYHRYGRSVYRRARNLLGDADAAKDVMQEVFMRAMRGENLDALSPNPLAWLYRTTTNLCLNRLRDARRRREILSTWSADEASPPSADARVIVRRILEEVPEELQDIAVYYYIDELAHDEIADIVGVSRRTIGNRLTAFHAHVAEFLAKEACGDE